MNTDRIQLQTYENQTYLYINSTICIKLYPIQLQALRAETNQVYSRWERGIYIEKLEPKQPGLIINI